MATETNIPVVSTKTALAVILAAYESRGRHPVMLWGPPGVGKTAIVYQAAEMIGGEVVDFRLVTTEPVDLRGYPVVVKDAEGNPTGMVWVPADLLPKDGKGILFLDELPQAPTMNMNAAAELVYDRRLGNDYSLPDGWMVVCAGNRRTDRAGTIEVPTHMKNRLTHLEVEARVEDWCEWAKGAGVHDGVISFNEANPRNFHQFNADALAFPTPRTWHMVSDYLHNDTLPNDVMRALIGGAVGKGAALELQTHLDRGKGLPRYEDIVNDPENAPCGVNENQSYALVSMVGQSAKLKDLDAVVKYLNRHRRELARPAVHRMISSNADFLTNPAFAAFAKQIGDVK